MIILKENSAVDNNPVFKVKTILLLESFYEQRPFQCIGLRCKLKFISQYKQRIIAKCTKNGTNKQFKRKVATVFISLNTCFGYSKEPYHRDGCFEYTPNIFGLRNRKNTLLLRTLICRTEELPPLTCISHVLFISLGSLWD